MSAPPPSGLPNGHNPNGQQSAHSGQPGQHRPPPIKRRPRGDPLVARKRPGAPRPAVSRPPPGGLQTAAGARPSPGASGHHGLQRPETEEDVKAKRAANGGWLDPAPQNMREFKIVTTKKALRDGVRHHVMKLSSAKADLEKRGIDPTNQEEFTRPVTLQRRDPRQPPPGREVKQEQAEPQPVDEKEAERLAQLKAEREAVRAVELAKSAPSLKDPNADKKAKPKEKEKDVQFHRQPRSEKEKKQQELRYEEALPWHLEDADGKNVWVGSYVAPLSETTICFVATRDGKFAAVPLEKWYKFTAKPHFNTMRLEEAEALMSKKTDVGRWYMRDKQKKSEQDEWEATRHALYGPARIKTESSTFRAASREEKLDHDQIDMEGDEFQDDDENPGLEQDNDEEYKEANDRIRRDQLGANLFGEADERRVEKELNELKKAEEERRKEGKKTQKALIKREKETIYQSDSSGYDPFESSSSEDDSDEEKQKEENKDKDKDEENKDKDKDADPKDKTASGVSSKGNTTPSGRQKHTDALKKGKSLKRPGSPNLSESSGNESSRKKLKKHAATSVHQSRSSTPSAGLKSNLSKGAMSDGEATGGEMSDGQLRKKKIKLVGTGSRGTPVGSRAGSPMPATSGSKPGSPLPEGSPAPRAGSPNGPIEAWEIVDALPELPGGISIGNLMRRFQGRIGDGPGQMDRKEWIKLVKENCAYGPDKILRRKPT
ncbi:Transcription initiation factor IIF subunit alpha [Colletotrichum tanaceti]|uniref:Transcription initiation factor IIF subunit alpha n=1 Tax=Colletotrichum tanaceti TaxID=1306861 RepID=A0A4U6XNC7_9PEZI|nr:Transcription initiation factor IIF subunit alpha [Colletotrichum tanaceti]TKW57253.1 Transcription initiation factor IIF subunit alpha [Colletotrichum tanaceti]